MSKRAKDIALGLPDKPPADFDLQTALTLLPDKPGIYRMFGPRGLLYVGKAKNLKNRVRSYFQSRTELDPRKVSMVSQITWFDTIVTHTEAEALMLEYNLIKRHQPKYNILLRDDKRFPWLVLSCDEYPRLYITRNPTKRERAFGPFLSSGSLYRMLAVLQKHFPLRKRRKPLFKDRPCMNFYIGQCPGPCQAMVDHTDYMKNVRQVELFLRGRVDDLLEQLQTEMTQASEDLNFEWAAKLRDRWQAVQSVADRQKMIAEDITLSQDVVGMARDPLRTAVTVLHIRNGRLVGSHPQLLGETFERKAATEPAFEGEATVFPPEHAEEAPAAFAEPVPSRPLETAELVDAYLMQHYLELEPEALPDELIVPDLAPDLVKAYEELLTERRQDWDPKERKVKILTPQRGTRQELLELARTNAHEYLQQRKHYEARRMTSDPTDAMLALQEALGLPNYPERLECYDISHIQGTHTVASMVVFTGGRPDKSQYRRFNIAIAEGKPDDFASMREAITRRLKHDDWPEPDLILIDGGKGQLSASLEAMTALGLTPDDLPIASLAKRYEEVYLPGKQRPIILPRNNPALFLLQQIRDEAHRFAITAHRQRRGKAALKSWVDAIPGIGPKRRVLLQQHFSSKREALRHSPEEMAMILNLPLGQIRQLRARLESAS